MADKTPIQPSLMLYLENVCLSTFELFVLGFKVRVANFEPRLTYFVGRLAEPTYAVFHRDHHWVILGSFLGFFFRFGHVRPFILGYANRKGDPRLVRDI